MATPVLALLWVVLLAILSILIAVSAAEDTTAGIRAPCHACTLFTRKISYRQHGRLLLDDDPEEYEAADDGVDDTYDDNGYETPDDPYDNDDDEGDEGDEGGFTVAPVDPPLIPPEAPTDGGAGIAAPDTADEAAAGTVPAGEQQPASGADGTDVAAGDATPEDGTTTDTGVATDTAAGVAIPADGTTTTDAGVDATDTGSTGTVEGMPDSGGTEATSSIPAESAPSTTEGPGTAGISGETSGTPGTDIPTSQVPASDTDAPISSTDGIDGSSDPAVVPGDTTGTDTALDSTDTTQDGTDTTDSGSTSPRSTAGQPPGDVTPTAPPGSEDNSADTSGSVPEVSGTGGGNTTVYAVVGTVVAVILVMAALLGATVYRRYRKQRWSTSVVNKPDAAADNEALTAKYTPPSWALHSTGHQHNSNSLPFALPYEMKAESLHLENVAQSVYDAPDHAQTQQSSIVSSSVRPVEEGQFQSPHEGLTVATSSTNDGFRTPVVLEGSNAPTTASAEQPGAAMHAASVGTVPVATFRTASVANTPVEGSLSASEEASGVNSVGVAVGPTAAQLCALHGVATRDSVSNYETQLGAPLAELPANATTQEKKEHLEEQLDRLANHVLGGCLLVLPGARNRLHGGQAVVQMVEDTRTKDQHAIKFFLSHGAFQQEKDLYVNPSQPLGKFLPQMLRIAEGADSDFRDPQGGAMAPCIVMEKGEALDVWIQKSGDHIDMFTGLQVLSHIAERLRDLHAAGYVHRDLKPGNIMWLPRKKRWTLIDFGCAARTGTHAPTGFSLYYAAPEALQAYVAGAGGVQAEEALDAWSLGVLAIELFTAAPVFSYLLPREKMIDMILGKTKAPWEDPDTAKKILRPLGIFKVAVLELLHRDAAQRSTIQAFLEATRRALGNTTVTTSANTSS